MYSLPWSFRGGLIVFALCVLHLQDYYQVEVLGNLGSSAPSLEKHQITQPRIRKSDQCTVGHSPSVVDKLSLFFWTPSARLYSERDYRLV